MKKAIIIASACAGIGYYAYKNREKLKRIMADVNDIMRNEKYMFEDMM